MESVPLNVSNGHIQGSSSHFSIESIELLKEKDKRIGF